MAAVGILAVLALIGWLSWRAAKRKAIKAYMIMYGLSSLAGIFTLAFFLNMDLPKIVKILVCIILGVALIFVAAWFQRRAKQGQAQSD